MKALFSQVVTVLCASRYSFADEEDKKRMVEGCKISYVMDWTGETRQNSKGLDLLTATLDIGDFDHLQTLPADYNATFSMRKGRKGEPVLHVDTLEMVADFAPYKSAHVPANDAQGKSK